MSGAHRGEWLLYLAILGVFAGIVAVAFGEPLLALFLLGNTLWTLMFGVARMTRCEGDAP